jgi:hypothetical protein
VIVLESLEARTELAVAARRRETATVCILRRGREEEWGGIRGRWTEYGRSFALGRCKGVS